MPPYVTWVVPSGRVRLPIWPVTPAPAVAWPLVSRGGQAVAQAPVQVDDVALSPACVYRVIPFGPVRTMPKFGELAEPTTTPAPVEVPPPIALGAAVPDEHAATARTAIARNARIRLRDMCDSEIYVRAVHGSCARSTRMPHQRFRAVVRLGSDTHRSIRHHLATGPATTEEETRAERTRARRPARPHGRRGSWHPRDPATG